MVKLSGIDLANFKSYPVHIDFSEDDYISPNNDIIKCSKDGTNGFNNVRFPSNQFLNYPKQHQIFILYSIFGLMKSAGNQSINQLLY
jgi:hypothetical protein